MRRRHPHSWKKTTV